MNEEQFVIGKEYFEDMKKLKEAGGAAVKAMANVGYSDFCFDDELHQSRCGSGYHKFCKTSLCPGWSPVDDIKKAELEVEVPPEYIERYGLVQIPEEDQTLEVR
ncbi:MAG: hypothetical protein LBL08_01090 [Candidatus Nomurabacteria bacterium]|jgi:hypothetical protein|nr:hypothetical protein [Candidatus Nomurabacteria bacterium]